MRGLFDLDSRFMTVLGKITDCIMLSLCWITFCIPLVTIGPSCGALYRSMYRCIRRDEGQPLRVFWETIKDNIKISVLVWLPILAAYVFLIADAIILRAFVMPSRPEMARFYGIILVLIAVCSVWAIYCTAYCVRFNGGVWEILRINFILVLSHPLITLEMMLIFVMGTMLVLLVPYLLIFMPCLVCLAVSFPMEKVFMQHMRPEDIEKLSNE